MTAMTGTNQQNRPNYRFPARLRLKRRCEFDSVYAARTSVADGRLIVYTRANGLRHSRVGISVGKKVGRAVVRNRHKRTLREAFRRSRQQLPSGCDFVVIPRAVAEPSTRLYAGSLVDLCRKAQRRVLRT